MSRGRKFQNDFRTLCRRYFQSRLSGTTRDEPRDGISQIVGSTLRFDRSRSLVSLVAKTLFPSHNLEVDSTRFLRASTVSQFVLQNVALHFSDDNPSQPGQVVEQGGIA